MEMSFNMIGLVTMLRFFTRKLVLNKRWLVVVLIAIFLATVMGYAATFAEDALVEGSDLINLLMLGFLLPIMALIYGASMIRNEMDDRSITTVITSPIDRRVSYLGYYISLTVVLTVMLLLVQLVGWATFFAVAGFEGDAVSMLLSYSALMVIGAVVYSSLFLAMGVLLKQPIYLGLIYAFVWEGFVGSVPGAIGDYTIMHQLRVIGSDLISAGDITEVSGDAAISGTVLAIATLVLFIIGAFAFRQKEIP